MLLGTAVVPLMMHKVTAMTSLMHKVKTEVTSMLVMEYQGQKYALGQKEVTYLVVHLVRKPLMEMFEFELQVLHCQDQMGLLTLMTVEMKTLALQYYIASSNPSHVVGQFATLVQQQYRKDSLKQIGPEVVPFFHFLLFL